MAATLGGETIAMDTLSSDEDMLDIAHTGTTGGDENRRIGTSSSGKTNPGGGGGGGTTSDSAAIEAGK